MKTTIEYLDDVKQRLEIKSDYELAKFLKVPRGTISRYQGKQRVIDDYTAAKIAEALGINPMEVIAAANAEREKDEKRKDYWRKVFASCAAACLLLMAGTLANQALMDSGNKPESALCAIGM